MRVLVRLGILFPLALSILVGCGDDDPTIQEPPDGSSKIVLSLLNFVAPDPSHYALWVTGSSTTTLVYRFTVQDGAPVGLDGGSLSTSVQGSSIGNGSVLMVSLESDTASTSPSQHVLVAGEVIDGEAELIMGHSAAFGVDLTGTTGALLLDTPTTSDPHDCENGIWWTDGTGGAALEIPTLPSKWKYEGWVVDRTNGEGYSTGRFTSPTGLDSDSAGSTASTEAAPYDFPGQDFVTATPSVPVLDLDNGLYGTSITIEPEPDNSSAPFALTILERNVATATMIFDVENLPPLLTGGYYEVWASFVDTSFVSVGSFNWTGNFLLDRTTGEQIAGLPAKCDLVGADYLLISVEDEADSDPLPSGSFLAAGSIVDDSASVSAYDERALGSGFVGGDAFYTLTTPSTPADEGDYSYGIWFFHVSEEGETSAAFDLPPAPAGWHYESWVQRGGNPNDVLPVSLGTFTDINALDSDSAGAFGGDDTLAVLPPYPGQDFVTDGASGPSTRWVADGNHQAMISLEPDNDFSPSTIFVTLFHDPMIVNVGPDTTQAMGGKLLLLPRGPVEYEATRIHEMDSYGNRLPIAKVSVGK